MNIRPWLFLDYINSYSKKTLAWFYFCHGWANLRLRVWPVSTISNLRKAFTSLRWTPWLKPIHKEWIKWGSAVARSYSMTRRSLGLWWTPSC